MKEYQNYKLKILLMLIVSMVYVSACKDVAEKAQAPVQKKPPVSEKNHTEYGIICNDLLVLKDIVQPNQNLSDILSEFFVPNPVIYEAATAAKDVFDVRKIKAGNPFCIISNDGSIKTVRYFVYECNPVDYVVFKLDHPVTVSTGKKEVQGREKSVSGYVESSLWETLTEQQLDIDLAIKLSEIYAWDIDFHHLQKGDCFRAIYEEQLVEGESIGPGKILAARFSHENKTLYAFYFEQDAHGSYYDENGRSLQKTFLKAPVKFSRITSGFSRRRFHPILGRYRAHFGIDYAAKTGTPIMTTGDGIVCRVGYDKNNGMYVKIRHNGMYTTQYLHMSKFARGIKRGKKVRQGDVIGYVGSTGLATGPHVCYRLWRNGRQVNPLREDIPSIEPVKKEFLQNFNQQMVKLKQKLDTIDHTLAKIEN